MAHGLSQTFEKAVLDCLLKRTNITAPTTLFVSLHGTDPGDTGAGELSGGAYARAALAPDINNTTHTNWNSIDQASVASSSSNKLVITFPQATADWNSAAAIKWFGLWDASTAGVIWWSGDIAGGTGVIVLNGTTLTFAAGSPGQLSVSID